LEPRRRDEAREISAEGLGVFRLPPHRREDRRIRGDAGKRRIEGRALDAARGSFAPERIEERFERRGWFRVRVHTRKAKRQHQETSPPHHVCLAPTERSVVAETIGSRGRVGQYI
jgi:hypothetical protein